MTVPSDLGHLSPSTLIVAEEFRVNMLVGAAGFPVMKYLADGSEKRTGERLAVNKDWNETVHMLAATSGTKALSGLLAGVKLVQPLWIPTLSELNRQLQKLWRKHTRDGTAAVASGFIGVVIGVVISQTEDRVAYREAFRGRQHTQETKGMGGS